MGPGNIIKPEMTIISGERNAGKTSYLQSLIRRSGEMSLSIGGFLSIPAVADGEKTAYYLWDLVTGSRHRYATMNPPDSVTGAHRGYTFNHAPFTLIENRLDDHLSRDMVIFDEFGPLEISGKGFFRILQKTIRSYGGIIMISVRKNRLHYLKNLLLDMHRRGAEKTMEIH